MPSDIRSPGHRDKKLKSHAMMFMILFLFLHPGSGVPMRINSDIEFLMRILFRIYSRHLSHAERTRLMRGVSLVRLYASASFLTASAWVG